VNPAVRQKLRGNLDAVEERIVRACARAGRKRSEVTLVAVTKTVTAEVAGLLPELGIFDLGENRPQELWRKSEALSKTIHWHLVGHLQRNKIDKTLPIVEMIHGLDSIRLLHALEQECAKQERRIAVLLEVNASGEASKQGFDVTEAPGLVPILSGLKQVRVSGLMTMAALQAPEACRSTFVALRQLRDKLAKPLAGSHSIVHLSMGMSNDFEIAIEEGATLIRLGTVLFEGTT
jgi:pyridoxal phosphate enzyme (YggS family)